MSFPEERKREKYYTLRQITILWLGNINFYTRVYRRFVREYRKGRAGIINIANGKRNLALLVAESTVKAVLGIRP